MKYTAKLKTTRQIIAAKILKKRYPLAVRWNLTYRCISKCKYCNVWKNSFVELETDKILTIINELADMGCTRISFSGGEPMLRTDIGTILKHCNTKGISTGINTTGYNIPEKISELKDVDLLKISLDGPKEIHETIRAKGLYKIAMDAAKAAKSNKIRNCFTTTITKYNINYIDFMPDIAKKFDCLVAFQPLHLYWLPSKGCKDLIPDKNKFKKIIEKLIIEKKKGNKHIRNSYIGLKHIYNWPNYEKLDCQAGILFCSIKPDGTVTACDRVEYNKPQPNCKGISFRDKFRKLCQPKCNGCGFCGALELNYITNFRIKVMKTIKRLI